MNHFAMSSSPFQTTNLYLIFSYTRAIEILRTPIHTGRARRRGRCWTSKTSAPGWSSKRIKQALLPFLTLSKVSSSGLPLRVLPRRNLAALEQVAMLCPEKEVEEASHGSKEVYRIPSARWERLQAIHKHLRRRRSRSGELSLGRYNQSGLRTHDAHRTAKSRHRPLTGWFNNWL